MSAYDDLYNELGEARRLGHMSSGWAQIARDLDAFKAEIAHSLAERIRADASEWDGWPRTKHGARIAADLIDPEVSDDPGH